MIGQQVQAYEALFSSRRQCRRYEGAPAPCGELMPVDVPFPDEDADDKDIQDFLDEEDDEDDGAAARPRPARTPRRVNQTRPAPMSTEGLEVFVQLVIAPITTSWVWPV